MMNYSISPAFKGVISVWDTTGEKAERKLRKDTNPQKDLIVLDLILKDANSKGKVKLGKQENTMVVKTGDYEGDFHGDCLVRLNDSKQSVTLINDKNPKFTLHRSIGKSEGGLKPIEKAITALHNIYEALVEKNKRY